MDKKRIEEAINILDNISNSIKESSILGKALETALVILEERKAYEDAKEQGLLHKAEIPNGTTIYVWQTDENDEWFIHSESYFYGLTEYFYGSFGKDFWTSKEEAEQALSEMKGGQDGNSIN